MHYCAVLNNIIYLLDVSKIPLTPPNVDNATNIGTRKAKLPYIFEANV